MNEYNDPQWRPTPYKLNPISKSCLRENAHGLTSTKQLLELMLQKEDLNHSLKDSNLVHSD